MDIRELPTTLIAAIRTGAWTTPEAETLRGLARVAGRAREAGLPDDALIDLLAGAARADLPVPSDGWTPEMRAIEAELWPYLASSHSMATSRATADEHGPIRTAARALEVAVAILEDERAKAAMEPGEADAVVRAEMERVRDLHPDLGMSYGYVGNILWGPRRDDRSFMVFTRLLDRHGHSVSFGGHAHDRLGELAHMATRRLEAWAADVARRLAAGELRRQG